MLVCPRCGENNPDRARFCLACAAPLDQAPAGEERKIVSVLFADLVGFTAASERADPEDVRAALAPYYASVKREIERFGGTVEKFIGDAVVGVFGAPVAHEDDPERAVLAALRIPAVVDELNEDARGVRLSVRIGVNTGEAIVAIGARPELGEGMVVGDVINTASRLQGVAPAGGVVVGEATYLATKSVADYVPLDPVELKGKTGAVPVWQALTVRGRFGVDVEQAAGKPFIGRDPELEILKQTYRRALNEPSVQLATITGEPGVGKSRLLNELRLWVDDQPEIVVWRQGRCLPYGDGITFWALGEMVKAHAGILESDPPEVAASKLDAILIELCFDGAERDWLRARLAPLIGAGGAGSGTERTESFAGWQRFLEVAATARPLVVVFEDLHWADDAMLEFIDHLVDWTSGVPMLVLCSARPELWTKHPGWGGGKRNSTTIGLSPLSHDDTARLLAGLLEQSVLPAEVQEALIARAGGNPLYAEEFVRMLADQGLIERHGTGLAAALDDVAVPVSVQSIISARLDGLPSGQKALVHDASVVGKVFWSGALAAVGGRDEESIRRDLHDLARKELVRQARRSSVEGQTEWSFWHILIRDVGYGQIPRGARADKHRAVARWIETVAGDRAIDQAELLAYHYEQALTLARAAGADADASLLDATIRFLSAAGDRASRLDQSKAVDYYARAIELAPATRPDRARLQLKEAEAAWASGRLPLTDVDQRYGEIIKAFREAGDDRGAGEAMTRHSGIVHVRGDTTTSLRMIEEAIAILERLTPGAELVAAYAGMAGERMFRAEMPQSLEYAQRALDLAATVPHGSLDRLRALQMRGIARAAAGRSDGLDDLREAIREAQEEGLASQAATGHMNLADWLWEEGSLTAAISIKREGVSIAERRGLGAHANWGRSEMCWVLFDSGDWDEALELSDVVIRNEQEQGATQPGVIARIYRAGILAHRGRLDDARALVDEFMPRAREIGDFQVIVPALWISAVVDAGEGRLEAAVASLEESIDDLLKDVSYGIFGGSTVWILRAAGRRDLLERLASMQPAPPHIRSVNMIASYRALVADASDDLEAAAALHEDAARRWGEFGFPLEEAHDRFGQGHALEKLRRFDEARSSYSQALSIFRRLGVRKLVAETESRLREADTGS